MNRGYILIIIATVLVAMSPLGADYAMQGNNPESASMYWMFFALVGAYILAIFTKGVNLKIIKEWKVLAPIGFFTAIGIVFWFKSIQVVGAELSSFLGRIGTIFLVMLSMLFLKEKFNVFEGLGAVIALVGVYILTFSPIDYLGWNIKFIVIGSICYSIGQIMVKKYASKISASTLTLVTTMFIFVFVLIYTVAQNKFEIIDVDRLWAYVLISPLSESVAVYLIFLSYQYIGVGKSQIIRSGFPFVVVIFSYLIYGRLPLPHQLFAGALIILGVIVLTAGQKIKIKEVPGVEI